MGGREGGRELETLDHVYTYTVVHGLKLWERVQNEHCVYQEFLTDVGGARIEAVLD